ncbi:MAG: hypothetical protein ACFCU1_10110 [Sumerlaeia bacterium]
MKCERCNQCDAVASITKVDENGIPETIRLGNCEECCHELRFLNIQSNLSLDIQEVLSELIEQEASKSFTGTKSGTKIIITTNALDEFDAECVNCGLKFSQYKKSLMLGCQYCYDSFHNELEPRLKKYHRVSSHLGAATLEATEAFELMTEIKEAKIQQDEAAEAEDFILAAELRKHIQKLEEKLSKVNKRAQEKSTAANAEKTLPPLASGGELKEVIE